MKKRAAPHKTTQARKQARRLELAGTGSLTDLPKGENDVVSAGWQDLPKDMLHAILPYLSPRSQARTLSVNKAANHASHEALQLEKNDWCRGVEPSCDEREEDVFGWSKREDRFGWSNQEEMKKKVEKLCACEYESVSMQGSLPESESIPTFTLGRMFRGVTSITSQKPNLRFLCRAISSGALENVEAITLKDNIGDEGMVEFCNAVASVSLTNLLYLNLADNYVGDATMAKFFRAIAGGSMANLIRLELRYNEIGKKGMAEFSRAISSGSLRALQKLHLDETGIDDDGMAKLSSAISSGSLKALQLLDLSYNKIGVPGMTKFSRAVSNGSLGSLETLYLHNNSIGDKGIKAVAIASRSLPQLQCLSLSWNEISDKGMAAFSTAITRSPLRSLTQLELEENNEISDDGMHNFSLAIERGLPSLNRLDISNPSLLLTFVCSRRNIKLNVPFGRLVMR